MGTFETVTKENESGSQSHCSADGKCSPDEKGEFDWHNSSVWSLLRLQYELKFPYILLLCTALI